MRFKKNCIYLIQAAFLNEASSICGGDAGNI